MGVFARTIAGEVAQIEPRGGHLRHVVEAGGGIVSTEEEVE